MNKIINWKTGETIIEDENLTIKELVEKAVKEKISLQYAYSLNADLDIPNLRDANLKIKVINKKENDNT